MKKNGFTLVELIAVIIILGILMIIAVPRVSTYIDNSRKSAYVATIKDVVASAGSLITKQHMSTYDRETTYYIPNNCIKTEKGIAKSPYSDFDKAYIIVGWENNNYAVYWVSRDNSGIGVKSPKKITEIDESDIESDIPKGYIKPDKRIGNTTNILILDESDCETLING